MKGILVAIVLVAVANTASAGPSTFPGATFLPSAAGTGGPTTRTVTIDPRSGGAVPAVTHLHPVIGSIQRTGHFTHPFTHKTKYTNTVYNPVLGQFGAHTFRR